MTPEEHSLLERTYKIAEENNDLLRSIRRSSRISIVMRVIYWIVIIGASVGAYYLIQPYVDSLKQAYSGGTQDIQSAASSIRDLLK